MKNFFTKYKVSVYIFLIAAIVAIGLLLLSRPRPDSPPATSKSFTFPNFYVYAAEDCPVTELFLCSQFGEGEPDCLSYTIDDGVFHFGTSYHAETDYYFCGDGVTTYQITEFQEGDDDTYHLEYYLDENGTISFLGRVQNPSNIYAPPSN